MSELIEYYARRATEYDRIYAKPERQADLRELEYDVSELVRGRRVLELACGTGWWTRVLAAAADEVVATDAGDEVLEVARKRDYRWPVEFRKADAFALESIPGNFDTVVAAFWLSHLPRTRVRPFLDAVDDRLAPGARVVLMDNRYVPGSSTTVTRRDEVGNTYQNRRLANGQEYEVRKNFFDEASLRRFLAAANRNLRVRELPHYWLATYDLVTPTPGPTPTAATGHAP